MPYSYCASFSNNPTLNKIDHEYGEYKNFAKREEENHIKQK
jgi:hypothetical protein